MSEPVAPSASGEVREILDSRFSAVHVYHRLRAEHDVLACSRDNSGNIHEAELARALGSGHLETTTSLQLREGQLRRGRETWRNSPCPP